MAVVYTVCTLVRSLLAFLYNLHLSKKKKKSSDWESSNQTIKSSFLYIFWDWVRMYIGDSVTSLINFVGWLGSL